MLPLRKLGKTDIEISALGLGTWQFSGGKGLVGGYWQALDDETTKNIVQTAITGGINWFDTAQAYGNGESERNLAKALHANNVSKDAVHIATKWWPVLKTANDLKTTINDRLNCLNGYPIAHHIIHQPLSISSIDAQMHAMADLMDAGKIRSIGVSNFSAKAMRKSHAILQSRGYVLAANQYRFSMLSRNIETNGILDAAKELGISIIAWSPLEQGILTGRFHQQQALPDTLSFARKHLIKSQRKLIVRTQPLIDRMSTLAESYGASISQVALNYLIHVHDDTVVAIPGASKVTQVEKNLGALSFQLKQNEIEELTALAMKK
jgi:aryl-alcohol dehydrogenase-like predicted oxidoreductase